MTPRGSVDEPPHDLELAGGGSQGRAVAREERIAARMAATAEAKAERTRLEQARFRLEQEEMTEARAERARISKVEDDRCADKEREDIEALQRKDREEDECEAQAAIDQRKEDALEAGRGASGEELAAMKCELERTKRDLEDLKKKSDLLCTTTASVMLEQEEKAKATEDRLRQK